MTSKSIFGGNFSDKTVVDATCFYYYGRNYAKNTVDFDNDIKCYESISNQIGWIEYDFKELKGLALFQLFKWFKFLKSCMVLLLFWDEEKTSNLDFFFTSLASEF